MKVRAGTLDAQSLPSTGEAIYDLAMHIVQYLVIGCISFLFGWIVRHFTKPPKDGGKRSS